jgi:hypothetical protein
MSFDHRNVHCGFSRIIEMHTVDFQESLILYCENLRIIEMHTVDFQE